MEIGGYFGFDLEKQNELPYDGLYFNSGSSALEFYLSEEKIKKIHIPEYLCPSLVKNIATLNIDIREYPVDDQLYPQLNSSIFSEKESRVLVVNYFGIRDDLFVLYESRRNSIIYDLAQALFYPLPANHSGFYSPRKFLGLTDGGILISQTDLQMPEMMKRSQASD